MVLMLLPLLMNNLLGGGISYQDYKRPFQYDPTQYTPAPTVYFSANLKTDAGTGRARLFNVTDGAAVAGGELTTASTSFTLLRTGALTLPATAKVYKCQAGGENPNTTNIEGSDLIVEQ
jgi:hypothetical protein